ncbi:MAG TPA: AMP-binding protein, partial [Haloferula sp.]
MLFSRWLQTLDQSSDRIALIDGAERVTFSDLHQRLASLPEANAPVIARGNAIEIVVSVLQGWRDSQPVLPLEKGAAIPDLPTSFPEGTAHLKLTPGIEGKPRAVFFSAEQIAADADRLVTAMGLRHEVPNLAAVSLTHSYGFSSIVLPLLLHGIPIHAVEVPFPKVMADAIAQHDGVVLPGVPSMWKAWHRSGILRDAKIFLAVSAGAPLSLELER